MDHPALGRLEPLEGGGWKAMLEFPAFRAFYERWAPDGTEWDLERDLDHLAGRFSVELTPIVDDRPGGRSGPPSAAQVAAVEYLLENQERVALEVAAALAREAPTSFHWGDVLVGFAADVIPRLADPTWIMQIVLLQGLVVGHGTEDGCAEVGFSFHSEILEVEHGVAVIIHRDRALRVGTWDELDGLTDRSFDDENDEDEDEDDG